MRRYYITLLLCALLLNENIVEWAEAMVLGGHTFAGAFERAFNCWSIDGYLLFTSFRGIPYLLLGLALFSISKYGCRDYVPAVFTGGLLGIVSMILWASWETLRPMYTGQRVSSTTALAFLAIPIVACGAGFVGALIGSGIQATLSRLRRTNH